MSMDSLHDDFQLMIWNAHSLRPKKFEFYDYMISNNVKVAAVTETFLNENDSIPHPDFYSYRLGRDSENRGGGVAIILHATVATRRPQSPSMPPNTSDRSVECETFF